MSLRYFLEDIRHTSKSSSPLVNLKWFVFNHTLHLTFLLRLGQDLYRVPVAGKLLAFVIEYVIRVLFASDISCRATIGPGLAIKHGHDIVIGAGVKIGRNCTIFNGVTLGNKDLTVSSVGAQPTLGDHVILSTGAKILGPIVLGDLVTVGANAVVLKNAPANTTLVGVPARIVGENLQYLQARGSRQP